MERIANYSNTKEILSKYNFLFKKNFGQNFLIDNNILDKIIATANIKDTDYVLEIGSGIGSLTQALAEKAKKVISIEIDTRLIPILNNTLKGYSNVEILNQDILKTNINEIIKQNNCNSIKVVANLPYYITTPIIMNLLEQNLYIESITVMIQQEVAQRLQAKPCTKDYGSLSLAVQYYSKPQIAFKVPADCFIPKPNVDSAIIHFEILKEPSIQVIDKDILFKLIKIGFSQRRKTFINCLINSTELNLNKNQILDLFNKANIDLKVRAEALNLEQFAKLANILKME